MLEVRDIEAGYGGIPVLKGLSFSVPERGIVTLLGANGAGKTTSLNVISGLLSASAGRVLFGGREITSMPPEEVVRLGICQVPEGRHIFPRLTVRENLLMGAFLHGRKDEVEQGLERVHGLFPVLRERSSQYGATLSGGEQQMLAIGRALMGRPRLLLLDEPSLGLAPMLVQQIFRIISEIHSRGCSVVLVEQNARQALKIARHGYVLETGRVIVEGPTSDLLSNEKVRRAYLGG